MAEENGLDLGFFAWLAFQFIGYLAQFHCCRGTAHKSHNLAIFGSNESLRGLMRDVP